MKSTLDNLLQRFQALSGREKIILVCTALTIIWSAWDNLVYQSLKKQQQTLQSQISIAETELTTQQQATEKLEQLATENPDKQDRQQLLKLQQSVAELKSQLSTENKKFVTPRLMATALRDMLSRNRQLRLIQLENKPSTAFIQASNHSSGIYRHELIITLQGSYFDTLNYLQSLEKLPWRINWDMINYKVIHYPLAEINIHLYTLSFEEKWLAI